MKDQNTTRYNHAAANVMYAVFGILSTGNPDAIIFAPGLKDDNCSRIYYIYRITNDFERERFG